MKAFFIGMLFVFRGCCGLCAFESLRGLVVLKVELIRIGGLLAVVDQLTKLVTASIEKRLFFGVELVGVAIGSLVEELCGTGVVLERNFGKGLLLGCGLRGLLLNVLRLLLHLLIDLRR